MKAVIENKLANGAYELFVSGELFLVTRQVENKGTDTYWIASTEDGDVDFWSWTKKQLVESILKSKGV